jgi:uridylate kinase
LFCAAGTGNPFFTTDDTAAARGAEIGGLCFGLNRWTKLLSADPQKRISDTVTYHTFDEAIGKNLEVI